MCNVREFVFVMLCIDPLTSFCFPITEVDLPQTFSLFATFKREKKGRRSLWGQGERCGKRRRGRGVLLIGK
jgi:hypothetical protein